MSLFIFLSYGSAAFGFIVLTVLLWLSNHRAKQARWLVGATAATGLWALGIISLLATNAAAVRWAIILDAGRAFVWLALLGVFLATTSASRSLWVLRSTVMTLSAGGLAYLMWEARSFDEAYSNRGSLMLLGMSLLVLLNLGQVYRNAEPARSRALIWLGLAIGGLFAYDIVVFSNALLFGVLDEALWSLRGFVAMLAIPALVVAAKQHEDWAPDLFISRHVAFYSMTLLGAGLYLLVIASIGYLISTQGGAWGWAWQNIFLTAGLFVLGSVLLSARLRANVKVFLAKHFYRSRYDYRREWLRLIESLSTDEERRPLHERCVKVLANILGSPGGELWLESADEERFVPMAAWRAELSATAMPRSHAVVKFLARTQWVIDTEEYLRNPERYQNAFDERLEDLPSGRIIVPLIHKRDLVGMAVLVRPAAMVPLDFEAHDLLKTVGRQVAVFAAQEAASHALAETRQFEAYNKLTTFLMHDLKNVVAQQDLLLKNAEQHQHRPEFVRDMVSTVEGSVARMKRILGQLQRGQTQANVVRLDVSRLAAEVVNECDDRKPVPAYKLGEATWVVADRERLRAALTHAVRNAQDATSKDGSVHVVLERTGGRAVIEIRDSGVGMDAEFIRARLFRPFDTTKGAKGMGIGAYQVREFIREIGGDVEVESTRGQGTVFRVSLPILADSNSRSVRRVVSS